MRRDLHYDAVVVGAGMHGLVAGTRLAQAGAKVCVMARGHGSLHLAPGTIDEPLEPEIAEWLKATVSAGPFSGYDYVDVAEGGLGLPTALGLRKRVWLAPSTMVAGGVTGVTGPIASPVAGASLGEKSTAAVDFSPSDEDGARIAIVGTAGLRDFQASLCAANLAAHNDAGGPPARAVEFDWRLDRADANSVLVARRFDDQVWRASFADTLKSLLTGQDAVVGLPAVLGLRDPGGVHADLQERLGRQVFEIPTLPPSVPGMRLYEILRSALRATGGRLVIGPQVEILETSSDGGPQRIRSVTAGSAGWPATYTADAFVFATGEDAASDGQALARGYRAVEVLT